MQTETLEDIYTTRLQDMYAGETQLVDALSEMAESAASDDLTTAFTDHCAETRQHQKRLEQVISSMGKSTSDGQSEGLAGLIREGQSLIKNHSEGAARDAGLIAAAQQVEHFEIAAYGTLCTYAEMLGRSDEVKILKETLGEEKSADNKLNDIATSTVNPDANA